MKQKEPLLIITGPTAVGKTKISIGLAKRLQGEIISADSVQVYRGMDIGSAKITDQEMEGVAHHLIDRLDPDEACNVAVFQEMAQQSIAETISREKLPIIVGGTGFYIQAILYGIQFSQEHSDDTIRKELEAYYEQYGANALHQRLQLCDPLSATNIHPNNVKRVIRAIEYYLQNGMCISEHNQSEQQKESQYQSLYVVLTNDRKLLYHTIEQRVDEMVEQGLIEEVQSLLQKGYTKNLTSMQAIGYKEVISYLEGDISKEEAIGLIKQNTRHFAKRQLTWFRRERNVYFVDKSQYDTEDEVIDAIVAKWNEVQS